MKSSALSPFVALLLFLSGVSSVKISLENLPERCDFTKCVPTDPQKLNVHLVPHTHDDVGWLKTVEQYYYGTANQYQKAGVQYILDSVVEELIRGKDRRFIYVETAFFWMWWKEQKEEQKRIVEELVKTGQLEFINGGWSMNDEATTHYNSIIDQMTWGHRRLNDTFGRCAIPKVAWQIDPFGHSREQANLFAAMNFDALFFAREDHQERGHRIGSKSLEHMWQGSDDLGKDGDLLTGLMKNHYGPLGGLAWDLTNDGDDPIIDNPESEEYNVPRQVEAFLRNAKHYNQGYPTRNILVPMGNDFHYMNARVYYKNMDKLIKAVNRNASSEVKVFYSTPSCYAKALQASNVTFSSKVDDFFPYSSDPHSYWTGYYTSRPALKRFERIGNAILQSCKQLDVLAGNGGRFEAEVTKLREVMGVMQHHDAVTGTEKQHVTNNYNHNLHSAIISCQSVISSSLTSLLTTRHHDDHPPFPTQTFCPHLNISSCAFTESGQNLVVTLYNPHGHTLANSTVRFPVKSGQQYRVFNDQMEPVSSYLVPVPQGVQEIPERSTDSKVELIFQMTQIPPLGLVSYFVKTGSTEKTGSPAVKASGSKVSSAVKLASKSFTLHFDAQGEVSSIHLAASGSQIAFKNEFSYYRAAYDNIRPSGAYVFRPREARAVKAGKVVEAVLFQNGTVQEVHQRFDVNWISQVVRIVPEIEAIEFNWVIGPIPVEDGVGREIVSRYTSSDLKNDKTFWTDANGRQVLRRQLNYRPAYNLSVTEPVSGNYYPVNSRIYLRDQTRKLQLTVLTDRSQGGTSLENGSLELMIHRRLLHDDYFGVGEALNEPGTDGSGLVIRGRHLVQLSSIQDSAKGHRELSQRLFLEPALSFSQFTEQYTKKYSTKYQGMSVDLPPNVHLLTLEEWRDDGQLLLRLEHFYQKGEDAVLSKPATISLKHLFVGFEIQSAQELTLSAAADIAALKSRLQFRYIPIGTPVETPNWIAVDSSKLEVTLSPMQIRTFVVKIKRH